jgi:hypothetical protein
LNIAEAVEQNIFTRLVLYMMSKAIFSFLGIGNNEVPKSRMENLRTTHQDMPSRQELVCLVFTEILVDLGRVVASRAVNDSRLGRPVSSGGFTDSTSRHVRSSGTRMPFFHTNIGRFGACCSIQGSRRQQAWKTGKCGVLR